MIPLLNHSPPSNEKKEVPGVSETKIQPDDVGNLSTGPVTTIRDETFHPISNFETMVHLLKGNIGTGLFAMPGAFLYSGLWVGSVLIVVTAYICTHCMHILVESAATLKGRIRGDTSVSYADVAEIACQTGSPQFVKFAKLARLSVNIFICITQFGFCCVYTVFTSTNLKQVVDYYAPELEWDVRVFMCLVTIPLIFLNWIRDLKPLAPVSFVANILQTISIVIVFYYIFRDGLPPISSRPPFKDWVELSLFFGIAVFSFEGIALVLPLQKDMRRPRDFEGWNGILNAGMVIVTILDLAMGFYGYLKYGDEIEGSITLNLPQDEILAKLVKIFMVLAIFGSYAMQFYVPIPILWPILSQKVEIFTRHPLVSELCFRTILVLVILAFAAAIPRIDLFISLVGALGSSFLALIFPPILELVTHWPNVNKMNIAKNFFIILFGLTGFTVGTYASIKEVIKAFT